MDKHLNILAERIGRSAGFRPWLADLLDRDEGEIQAALSENDMASSYFADYLSEIGLRLRSDRRWTFDNLDSEARAIIGTDEVVLFHATSSVALPSIAKRGLVAGERDINRHGIEAAGVYLSARENEVGIYGDTAVHRMGGYPVTIEVVSKISDLRCDPDDSDIASGNWQFVVERVSPGDIANVADLVKAHHGALASLDEAKLLRGGATLSPPGPASCDRSRTPGPEVE